MLQLKQNLVMEKQSANYKNNSILITSSLIKIFLNGWMINNLFTLIRSGMVW